MRPDLRERLEFLADELVREEALGVFVVSIQRIVELRAWSLPLQIRFVEDEAAPGLFELEARALADSNGSPK